MKKLLAMVLALVMTLSLAVSANAAFKDDKSISDDYAESVAVLNAWVCSRVMRMVPSSPRQHHPR